MYTSMPAYIETVISNRWRSHGHSGEAGPPAGLPKPQAGRRRQGEEQDRGPGEYQHEKQPRPDLQDLRDALEPLPRRWNNM